MVLRGIYCVLLFFGVIGFVVYISGSINGVGYLLTIAIAIVSVYCLLTVFFFHTYQ